MVPIDETSDKKGKSNPKKYDMGIVLVVLILVTVLTIFIYGIYLLNQPSDIPKERWDWLVTFEYQIWLQDYPQATETNTYTEVTFGDYYRVAQKKQHFDNGSIKLFLINETRYIDDNVSFCLLQGWVAEPTVFTISTYQLDPSIQGRELIRGELIKQEIIKVTPGLFGIYNIEIVDVYENSNLNWDNYS